MMPTNPNAKPLLRALLEVLVWVGFLLFASAFAPVFAQNATQAGTNINNQAVVSYVAADGQPYVAVSNVTTSVVRSVLAFGLVPDASNAPSQSSNFGLPIAASNDILGNPGSSATFYYSLTNTGNDTDAYRLNLVQTSQDDFDLQNPEIFLDSNNNAQFDAADLRSSAAISLTAGASINVFVVGTVPSSATGETRFDLTATSSGGAGLDNNNLSRLQVVRDAVLSLRKSVSSPSAGQLEYQLLGSNIGSRPALSLARAVVVDGAPLDGVLLTDPIPSGTQLDPSRPASFATGSAFGGLIVYQTGGVWSAVANPNASQIGLLLRDPNANNQIPEATLAVGAVLRLSFTVRILPQVLGGTSLANIAELRYNDNSSMVQRVLSNEVLWQVQPRNTVRIQPRDGSTSGTYTHTEPTTGRSFVIERSGDDAAQTDTQTITNLPGGTTVSFVQQVLNTGNVADTFRLESDYPVQFLDETMLLPRPTVRLLPNERAVVVVRFVLPDNFSSQVVQLTVRGSSPSASDITQNLVLAASRASVLIGPLGKPSAQEYPDPADSQSVEIFEGDVVRYPQTVQNASSFADTLELALESAVPSGWTVRFVLPDGSLLPDTNNNGLPELSNMAPLEQREVLTVVTPPRGLVGNNAGTGWRVLVRVQSLLAPRLKNRTLNILSRIRASSEGFRLEKSVSATRVAQGARLEYNLTFENLSGVVQSNVRLTDLLSPWLETPTELPANASFDAVSRLLVWQIDRLAVGERQTVRFAVRVRPNTPDLERITNRASLQSQAVVTPLVSNTVQTDVLGALLQLEKVALQTVVGVGDSIEYELRLRNASLTASLDNVVLTDVMPAGVVYKPGSARRSETPLEPSIRVENGVQVLSWNLGTLPPQALVRLRLVGIVTPNAALRVENRATASAQAGVNQIAVQSNGAVAAVKIEAGIFGRASAVLGRVYFDHNQNRIFDQSDVPLGNARIYLSNGSYAITDQQGRYSFPELPPGLYLLRLDPISVPWLPVPMPGDQSVGTRRLEINDPAPQHADFPLRPASAKLAKCRSTMLERGGLRLEKTLEVGGAGYVVTLQFRLEQPVANLRLLDGLPSGAMMQQLEVSGVGLPTWFVDAEGALHFARLEPGVYRVRYALLTGLPPELAMTDPVVDWDEVN